MGLRAHCHDQNAGGLQDAPLCSCYLAPETYIAIRKDANKKMEQGSEIAQLLNKVIQTTDDPSNCWYVPCHDQDNRPGSTCPSNEVLACIQVTMQNSYSGGGTNNHLQTCNIKSEPTPTPKPAPAPAGAASGKGTDRQVDSGAGEQKPAPKPDSTPDVPAVVVRPTDTNKKAVVTALIVLAVLALLAMFWPRGGKQG